MEDNAATRSRISVSCVAISPPESFTINLPPASSTAALMESVSVVLHEDILSVCEKPTIFPFNTPPVLLPLSPVACSVARYVGGINIFGEKYGDYPQGITMQMVY